MSPHLRKSRKFYVSLAMCLLQGLAAATRGRRGNLSISAEYATELHPCDNLPGEYDTWKSNSQNVGVVIVGGGVAGLTAAVTLLDGNITDFILLEADDYLGGRVKTYREGSILVEDGAEWIHGGKTNPLYKLAKELNALSPVPKDNAYDRRVRTEKGKRTISSRLKVLDLMDVCMEEKVIKSYYNTSYGQCYLDRFPGAYGKGANSSLGQAWLHLLNQMVLYDEGADSWLILSALDASHYVNHGRNHQWKTGYDTLIKYLKAKVQEKFVKLSTPVCRIIWDGNDDDKVLLVTKGGHSSYMANHVIVTSSVGHLKARHDQLFKPRLPAGRIRNLASIELGTAEKVQIGWLKPWWSKKPLQLYILWKNFALPIEMEWMYGIVQVMSVHQQTSILEVFVTGHHATGMENLPEETVRDHLVSLLSNVTNTKVPQPTFFRRTNWGGNPWTVGSYSSYVTTKGDKFGILSRKPFRIPLRNSRGNKVVLWAGEHTHTTRFSTVDGAMTSGQRSAHEVIDLVNDKQRFRKYS